MSLAPSRMRCRGWTARIFKHLSLLCQCHVCLGIWNCLFWGFCTLKECNCPLRHAILLDINQISQPCGWGMEWRQVLKRFPPLLSGHDPETSRTACPSRDLQVMAGGLYRTTSMFIHTCCTWMQGCVNLARHQEQKRILCKIPCPWFLTSFILFIRIFSVLLLIYGMKTT